MRELLVKWLIWYNVLSLGIWLGGTVYQMLVIVPLWSASPPASVRTFFLGTAYLSTITRFFGPATQVARAVPLLLLAILSFGSVALRPWLTTAALTMVVGLAMTRLYVYPINDILFAKAGAGLSDDAIRDLVRRWIFSDRLRFAIMSVGYLCLLRAFSLPIR